MNFATQVVPAIIRSGRGCDVGKSLGHQEACRIRIQTTSCRFHRNFEALY
jgi:hypothetical protein